MRKFYRIALWLLVSLVVTLTAVFLYLRNADLSRYETQIENFLSETVGHKVDVSGLFKLQFGTHTQLTAENITLSNEDWPSGPVIVSVGHLSTTINLWSLFSRPTIIEDLTVRDVVVRLERNADLVGNWESDNAGSAESKTTGTDRGLVAFNRASIDNVQVTIISPARKQALLASINKLTVSPNDKDILDLNLIGTIDDLPLQALGKLGPWENLIDGRDVEADLDLSIGQVRLLLEGTIDDIPQASGIEASVNLSGPAIERLAGVFGIPQFADGEFEVGGVIQKEANGNQLRLEGNLGEIELRISGFVDEFISPGEANIDFSFSGPDTRRIAKVFGLRGAAEAPFSISGKFELDGQRYGLTNTELLVASGDLNINGWVELNKGIPDGNVTISGGGPDLSVVGSLAGFSGIPAEDFEVGGHLQKDGKIWRVDDIEFAVGENRLSANGQFSSNSTEPQEIIISATGPNIGFLNPMMGKDLFPEEAFEIVATLKPHGAGFMLETARFEFGANQFSLDGVVGTDVGFASTDIVFRAEGPELKNIQALAGISYLPDGPFSIAGRAAIDNKTLRLSDLVGSAGDINVSGLGAFGLDADTPHFDIDASLSGLDLSMLVPHGVLNRMNGVAFAAKAHVIRTEGFYTVESLFANVENLKFDASGRFAESFDNGTLDFNADAEDSAVLAKFLGLSRMPEGNLSIKGRVVKTTDYLEFTDARAQLGEFSVTADGILSTAPMSNRSDLVFSASGPELLLLGLPFNVEGLPAMPFSANGEINGTPTGFAIENLEGNVGKSIVNGEVFVDLRGKPSVEGQVTSTFLDLAEQIGANTPSASDSQEIQVADGTVEAIKAGEVPEFVVEKTSPANAGFLFSDVPLQAGWLQAVNIDMGIKADRIRLRLADVNDVTIAISLDEGALTIDPVLFSESAGNLSGSLHLAPSNGNYLLDVSLSSENLHLGLLADAGQDRTMLPPINGQFELRGTGGSLHEIAASSNGRLSFRQGSGQLKRLAGAQFFGDVLLGAVRSLTPSKDEDEYTTLECAIYDIDIKDGVATIENLAIQSRRLAIAARGHADFSDEKIDLSIQAKSREGIGISVGGVANSFLKLGGTLQDPKLRIDATASVATTGAAVATGGLSLLAKGLWDRVRAEGDICKQPDSGDASG